MRNAVISFYLCAMAALGTLVPFTAKGVVTEPEKFGQVINTKSFLGHVPVDQERLLSFGSIAGVRVLTYHDTQTHGMPVHLVVDNGSIHPIYVEYNRDVVKPLGCLWGGEVLFCQAKADVGGTPSDVIFALHQPSKTTLAHAFSLGSLLPDGLALRGAYDGSVLVEDNRQGVHLLTVSGGVVRHDQLATGGYDHSAVIGRGGAELPFSSKETYVVWQERSPRGGWILRSWDVDQGRVVAEVDAGSDPPNPSDLFGYAFLSLDDTIKVWDPSEPFNPDGPINPRPILDTPMDPSFHGCRSLENMKAGGTLSLVVGQGCSNVDGLFMVPRDEGSFVVDWQRMIYQPFDTEVEVLSYAIDDHWMAYVDSSRDLWLSEIRLDRVMPIEARTSPWDNNAANPVPLAPWNVGSWGTGGIDFDWGGIYQDWKVYLSENQTYRIFVISTDHPLCGDGAWYYDTRMTVSNSDGTYLRVVDDNETTDLSVPPTCAGVEISPGKSDDYTVRVDRLFLGPPGYPRPPLNYLIYIEVL